MKVKVIIAILCLRLCFSEGKAQGPGFCARTSSRYVTSGGRGEGWGGKQGGSKEYKGALWPLQWVLEAEVLLRIVHLGVRWIFNYTSCSLPLVKSPPTGQRVPCICSLHKCGCLVWRKHPGLGGERHGPEPDQVPPDCTCCEVDWSPQQKKLRLELALKRYLDSQLLRILFQRHLFQTLLSEIAL